MTTKLNLVQSGTIDKPGPIGRLFRLFLGLLSLAFIVYLDSIRSIYFNNMVYYNWGVLIGLIYGFSLLPYIVNIGFSINSGKRLRFVAILALVLASAFDYFSTGNFLGLITRGLVYLMLIYLYGHLGLSHVLASIIATPGCEMRAFPHLWSLITKKPTKEHCCPVGPLSRIDRWEKDRKTTSHNEG